MEVLASNEPKYVANEKSRKPSGNPWKQQQLAAFQPILTPKVAIITYMIIGMIFIPLGIVFLTSSNKVTEVSSNNYANFNSTKLVITFTDIDMTPPIYMYYELSNFYQNHRRYVRSRCDEQLRGVYVEPGSCPDCETFDYFNNTGLEEDFYFPCGLQVKNVFNDTFVLVADNSSRTVIPLNTSDVTWASDLDEKFNNPPVDENATGIRSIPNLKDTNFINWMRTAAFSNFRKLYRVINEPLKGNFTVFVTNNFNVTAFGGKKFVVLSTVSWIGGKNQFLGISYLVVGSVCILLGFLFILKQLIKPRLPGDVQYLEWSN